MHQLQQVGIECTHNAMHCISRSSNIRCSPSLITADIFVPEIVPYAYSVTEGLERSALGTRYIMEYQAST